MGRSLRILSIVILLIQISSCTNEAPQNTPGIIGTVTDTDGNLINDVNVYFVYHFSDVPYQPVSKSKGVDTVSLSYFTASLIDYDVLLEWATLSEHNNKGFEVERKMGSLDYSAIAFIEGNGTSDTLHLYSYTDKNLYINESYAYRLKQIDFDGSFQYSQEVQIVIPYAGPDSLYQNYPNPFNNYTIFSYSLSERDSAVLDLTDYYSLSPLCNFVNDEFEPGRHSVEFHTLDNYPNDIYKIKLKIIKNGMPDIEQVRDIFINRTRSSELLTAGPNQKTDNGRFEVDISALPLHKSIYRTSEYGWTITGKIEAVNLITFVLIKSGYKTLQIDYSIDEFNRNDFTFVMGKQ